MNWKYNISTSVGNVLHETIRNDGDSVKSCVYTLESLLCCVNYICSNLTGEISLSFKPFQEDVEGFIDEFKNIDSDIYDEDTNDCVLCIVNSLLDQFYDLCDFHSIWIGS